MPRETVGGLFGLLDEIERAHAPELPGLVQELTHYLRGNAAQSRRLLDEAERDAPRLHRRIDALRREHENLEDELNDLTTGEVPLSVFAAHLKLLDRRESEVVNAARWEDIGVGD